VKVTEQVETVSVSPVVMVFEVDNVAENRKLPAVAASHTLILVIASLFWAEGHEVHDGEFESEYDPAEAAANVIAGRVVLPDASDVPDAPGLPVCN
jgi:hypothetical protein